MKTKKVQGRNRIQSTACKSDLIMNILDNYYDIASFHLFKKMLEEPNEHVISFSIIIIIPAALEEEKFDDSIDYPDLLNFLYLIYWIQMQLQILI